MTSLSNPALSLSARSARLTLAPVRQALRRWQDIRRTRAALARLDSHLLQDIGLEARFVETPLPRLFPGF